MTTASQIVMEVGIYTGILGFCCMALGTLMCGVSLTVYKILGW